MLSTYYNTKHHEKICKKNLVDCNEIDNKSDKGEPLIKFGCSNFLCDRVKSHKKTYENFKRQIN